MKSNVVRLLPLLLLLGACAADVPTGASGASLVRLGDGRLAVVDADADSVSFLDEETLEASARVEVGSEPRALLVLGGRLYAALRRSGELVELALDGSPRVLRRQLLCTGPRALAATPEGRIAVACEWDGTVRLVEPSSLAATVVSADLDRPVAVAAAGSALFALEAGGRLHRLGEGDRAVDLVPASDEERPALASMVAHNASALALVDGGRAIAVSFELVNPSGDGKGERIADDYGSVTDVQPKINPALRLFSTEDLGPRAPRSTYARYDGAPGLRCNGPSALYPLGDGTLLVAHRSSNDVAVIDPGAEHAGDRLIRSVRVGAGPAGIVVDDARGVAWVDDAFDGAVSRVVLADGQVTTRARSMPQAASALALAGRRAFFDATDSHVSPAGVIACATCHPEGGSDGIVWFIRAPTIPAKRRLTPDLANAGADTAPYHWDGALPDRPTLVQKTITGLMAGDALLVDGTAIAAYLDELVHAPVAPAGDPAAIARGEQSYARGGCASCHPAPRFTDAQRHTVLADPGTGPDALTMVDTPALRGVGRRRAFFHDGRAHTLEAVIDAHGQAQILSNADRADLLAYLREL